MYNLFGEPWEQDTEIDDIYKKSVSKHGEGNVLGILATKSDNHDIYKREVEELSTSASSVSPTEEPIMVDSVYIAQGDFLLIGLIN